MAETIGYGKGSGFPDLRGTASSEKPVKDTFGNPLPIGSTYWEIDGEHHMWMFDGENWIDQDAT